jgi:hypothetical protein
VILGTYRSPLTPLSKGGTRVKVPLFKGDLGGSKNIRYTIRDFSNTLLAVSFCFVGDIGYDPDDNYNREYRFEDRQKQYGFQNP